VCHAVQTLGVRRNAIIFAAANLLLYGLTLSVTVAATLGVLVCDNA